MLFSGIALGLVLWRTEWARPRPDVVSFWPARLAGLPHLPPPPRLFMVVVGSIYVGVATPIDEAALGLMATVLLVALDRRLTIAVLLRAFD